MSDRTSSKADSGARRSTARAGNTPPPPSATRAPQRIDRAQRKRNSDDDDVKTAKKTPAPEESKEAKAQSENSSIVTIGSDHDKTTPVTEQKKTDLAKSDKSKSSNENSTIASVASSATANADPVKGQLSKRVDTDASGKTVATCKRYFPTVGPDHHGPVRLMLERSEDERPGYRRALDRNGYALVKCGHAVFKPEA